MRVRSMLVSFAVLAAGCGGGADSTESFAPPIQSLGTTTSPTTTTLATTTTVPTDASGLVEGLVADLLGSNEAGQAVPITEDQARCVANGVVAAIPVDRLTAVGAPTDFRPEELSVEDQAAVVDAMLTCVDFGALVVAEITSGMNISQSSAQCIVDGLDQMGLMRTMVLQALSAGAAEDPFDDQTLGQLSGVMLQCLSPDEIADLFGTVPEG